MSYLMYKSPQSNYPFRFYGVYGLVETICVLIVEVPHLKMTLAKAIIAAREWATNQVNEF